MIGVLVPVGLELGAQECVATPPPVQIDFLLDESPHMVKVCGDSGYGSRVCRLNDWKLRAAGTLALRILEGLTSAGLLDGAGGGALPHGVSSPPPGLNYYPVSPASADGVHTWLGYLFASPEDWYFSYPLFGEVQAHAERLQALPGSRKVLVVISHMGSWRDVSNEATARRALEALVAGGGQIFFFQVGPPVLDASAPDLIDGKVTSWDALSRLAAGLGTFGVVDAPSTDWSGTVLAALSRCENHRPVVSLSVRPNPLVHGVAHPPDVTLDASGSHDAAGETPAGRLIYHWRVTQPDGTTPPAWGPHDTVGSPQALVGNPRPFGTYHVYLDVDDGAGGVTSADAAFEVQGSPPTIQLQVEPPVTPVHAGVDLRVRTTVVDDLDNEGGGGLTFDWRISGGPPAAAAHVAGLPTDRSFVGWHTTTQDLTVLSDGTRLAPPWHFELTVRDDDGETAGPQAIDVDVANRAPEVRVDGSTRRIVKEGETIPLNGRAWDPDGGTLRALYWDVVQAPNTAAARGVPARNVAGGASPRDEALPLEWTTGAGDAGTWIFRLVATDAQGESDSADVTVVVDSPPVVQVETRPASAGGVVEIGSLTGALDLDASRSMDPDAPCGSADLCHSHTNLEGPAQGVTEGVRRFTWTLVDVPREWEHQYHRGGVAESLPVAGNRRTLHLDPRTLRHGDWTFELTIEDDEGNENLTLAREDPARVRVRVLDESHEPVAIVSDPARYTLDPFGRSAVPIEVSGARSFDLDNYVRPTPRPRNGIQEYRWQAVGPCEIDTAGELSPELTLFPSGTVPVECRGFWTVRLTVVDYDEPTPRRASTSTTLVIGTCPQAVCIDFPRTTLPAVVEWAAQADVPIYYHVDPSLRGLVAYLEIFDDQAPDRPPIHTAFDSAPEESAFGSSLAFHWVGDFRLAGDVVAPADAPRVSWPGFPGLYSVKISLVDPASGAVVASALEPASIWIEVNREARVSLVNAGGHPLDHARIARWDGAYRDDFSIRNLEAGSSDDDFIERDPAHFYVRASDPAYDLPGQQDVLRVQIGTLQGDGSVHDPLHEIALFERTDPATGRHEPGDFVSRAQLLVMPSVLRNNDDEFRANWGDGPVSDEAQGDRTHAASVDGYVVVRKAGFDPLVTQLPVCGRTPGASDARLVGTVNFVIFNMPYIDSNGNGAYDMGEQFMYTDPAQPHWEFHTDVGTWGPVMPPGRVQRLLDEANAFWSPACISFERGRVEVRDFPALDPESDAGRLEPRQHGDEVMSTCGPGQPPWTAVLPSDFFVSRARSEAPGDYTVFIGTALTGCGGYSVHAFNWSLASHPELVSKPFSVLPLRMSEVALAHELGHVLTNRGDGDNPPSVFFPQVPVELRPYTDLERGPTSRTDVNLSRRFSLATQNDARTDRRQFHAIPGDITSDPPSDPYALGNYLLRPVDR